MSDHDHDPNPQLTETDRGYLRRCVELAQEALAAGDEPFGSVLVLDDAIVAQDRNRVAGGDRTRHPELSLARWAIENLQEQQRAVAQVYTSGEHCPMCAAAHGWAGLGRIVYATSSAQLGQWLREWGVPAAPVALLPIQQVVPGVPVAGPEESLTEQIRELHHRCHVG
ncbi:nucleoside deaminase [Gephyromycinifex aptenodytis]|uniref:nucleoside deaminase n=1 Tax=Gephyromycinifex aptenodytis TaxID=2716227 RepID=UPI001445D3FE|nr:nucleoside deaminase [Gephyromycinifex aptenodytis]